MPNTTTTKPQATRKAKDPVVTTKKVNEKTKTSIELGDIPQAIVEVMDRDGLKIELSKLNKHLLFDQGSGMVASDGCISNPGGPGC